VKCGRIRLAVSWSPQTQPHFIRGPAGRPLLTFTIPCRRSRSPEGCRPLGAQREVCAHIAPSKLGAAAPTAFHPRPSWAPDEIVCREPLELPYTNRSPTLATALRHTITAERQNGALLLLKVNVLAATQTDGHVSGASRTARVIALPVFGRDFFNYSILRLIWTQSRISVAVACPRINCRRPPRVWVRAIWRGLPFPQCTRQPPRQEQLNALRRPTSELAMTRNLYSALGV
jgi:hypothetical protein